MILKARNLWWKQAMKLGGENDIIQSAIRYGNDQRFSEIESSALSHEELDNLRSVVQDLTVPTAKALVQKIDTIKHLYAEPKGAVWRIPIVVHYPDCICFINNQHATEQTIL